MHNAAFDTFRMDWRYLPFPVRPERVGAAVAGLPALGIRGVNVTIPHKQTVMPHLQRWTPAAEAIGAVNTITVEEDGELWGDNTDARGFIADLVAHHVDPGGSRVLVLGAGGSARAVVYGLAEAGAAAITVLNRTESRAESLVTTMADYFPTVRMDVAPFPAGIATQVEDVDLIVNCTSVGMEPDRAGLPWDEEIEFVPGQVVYDLIYNPPVTRLLQLATADGARAFDGLGMLIHQGALAWEIWTGESAPVETMRRAVNIVFDR